MDFNDTSTFSRDERDYGSRILSECERHGMINGCKGCPVWERGDCDNYDGEYE